MIEGASNFEAADTPDARSQVLPERISSEVELEDILTRPSPRLVEWFGHARAHRIVILGAGGKMGPTLARLASRAIQAAGVDIEVVAVARFNEQSAHVSLERHGISTIAADLMDRRAVEKLPDAELVVYMVGRKFGTSGSPSATWAVNTIPVINAMNRYHGSVISAFSTGTVYPLVPVSDGGSREADGPAPIGEYANACLARERLFEYLSVEHGTRVVLLRLNYAVELRYGVLVDIAGKVFRDEPVDVSMGYLNCIWQGDANDFALRSLTMAGIPAVPLNITGEEILSVRELALRFATLFGRTARIIGSESESAYLNDASLARTTLGAPATPIDRIIEWTATWIAGGGRTLDRPTHFEVSDGRY